MYTYVITGKTYSDYTKWRRGPGYKLWRKRQWMKQKGRCFYCNLNLENIRTNVEHVMPVKRSYEEKKKQVVDTIFNKGKIMSRNGNYYPCINCGKHVKPRIRSAQKGRNKYNLKCLDHLEEKYLMVYIDSRKKVVYN